jgi:hypothetical protein
MPEDRRDNGQMALLQVNARGGRLEVPAPCGRPADMLLAEALSGIPADAPITVLVHGFKFSPFEQAASPHSHIFALTPRPGCWKALSWPAALGFSEYGREDGLCIAFGWPATAPMGARGLRRVYARTEAAAEALAALLEAIAALTPGRRADVLAHSLGARVLLSAMARLKRPALGRAILMAPADFAGAARAALANPAAAEAELFSVLSGENALYDFLFERCVPAPARGDRALGRGLDGAPGRWVDIRIDCERSLAALAIRGLEIAPRARRFCHWSVYLRPGIFALYRALLRDREAWSAAALRRA